MRQDKELAAAIRTAMRRKNLTEDKLGEALGTSPMMIHKLLCGEVVPSRHLEKQMIETLGINEARVKRLGERGARRPVSKDTKSSPKGGKAA